MTHATLPLHGRPCLVTGGGTGIGRGIASCLARAGADVVIGGRRQEVLEQTAAHIRAHGGACTTIAMDVADADSVASAFDALDQQLGLAGRLYLLVNNAGTGGPNACALDGPERWPEILSTNVDGVFHCSREALRRMPDGSRVVNISSVLGKFGVPGYTAYCASKHAVIGFTKALALEVAPRQITVNAVCPGWVDTEMAHAGIRGLAAAEGVSYEQAFAGAMGRVPLGRIMQPEEIGELVVYLASSAASGMTGQAISLCGGSTMG
ncbi:MAG: SDR family oxidoreductase [Planctomycetes bacterium]|nr:SDR family oxidoreductase [Planctomycetota bacterium]MCB9872174.1 SDR family oxidoreductase [Planctomycetota bacterium]